MWWANNLAGLRYTLRMGDVPGSLSRQRPFRTLCSIAAIACIAGTLPGCQDPLFSPRETRTQFDRYDRSRDQYEPQFFEDEFGHRVPNLRGRLTPKA